MNPDHRSQGFSLIEVMVVLVIIGIATAAISVTVSPNPSDTLRLDARELAQRLTAAQHEVRMDGRVIAWQPLGDGYHFTRGTWVDMPGSVVPAVSTVGKLDRFERDDVLRPRKWHSGVVNVTPAKPVLLTSEWIGAPLQLELSTDAATVVIERDASGAYLVP